jgi:O-antigen/teichoic acid export membrane protein
LSGIRLTYAGLLALVIRLASVITGLVFVITVTRNLTPEDFGLWRLIGGLISYVVIAEPIVSYWTVRQTARGEPVGRTAPYISSMLATVASLAYVLIILFVSGATSSNFNVMLIATILVPVSFIANTLDAVNLGYKPQASSFALLAFEFTKIPIGIVLVAVLGMGLTGAIVATFAAFLARIFVLAYGARKKIAAKFSLAIFRMWLKLAWLPLYNNGPGVILGLDVLVFSLIVGSVEPLSLYAAVTSITAIVVYSSGLSQALYPKLLADNRKEHIEIALKRTFLFSIPIFVALIVFAEPSLFILNPAYTVAVPALYVFAAVAFGYAISGMMYNIVGATERVDINLNSKIIDHIKSKLFFIPTLLYIQNGLYLGLLVFLLIFTKSFLITDLNLVILWAFVGLATQLPFTIYFTRLAHKALPFKFPWSNMGKYALSSLIAAMIMLVLNNYILIYDNSIYSFAPRIAAALSLAAGIYFSVLYAIDVDFRMLSRAIIAELKDRK